MNDIEGRLRRLGGELSGRVDPANVEHEVRRRAGGGGWKRAARAPAIAFLVVALTVGGWIGLSAVFKGSRGSPPLATGSGPNPSAPVVVPPTSASPAAVPELSGTMAFIGTPGIFLLDPSTEKSTKVVGGAWAAGIQWSPDGTKIAYGLGLGESHGQIVVYDFDAKKSIVIVDFVTSGPERSAPSYPAWSPDGGTIAFTTGDGAAYTVGSDGSNLAQITGLTDDGCADRRLAWSHDGSAIFSARECSKHSLDGIYSFSPSGTDANQLVAVRPIILGLSVSPDGSSIAFGERYQGIFVVSTEGTNLRQLTSNRFDAQPTWSPDGSVIAFSRAYQAWAVPGSGGEAFQVTHFDSPRVVDLAWSPVP
jgi:Tol biopolymer transport system component